MKISSPLFLKKVSSKEINRLTKEINETLDIEFKKENAKKFNSVDLWNIHRHKRSFSTRRFI